MTSNRTPRRPACPKCGWSDVRPAALRALLDPLLRTFSVAPWRCRSCGTRFYGLRRREPEHEAEGANLIG